eukprot:COSAG01_NODE_2757_length_7128_cov_12.179542_2_plen_333_part_00
MLELRHDAEKLGVDASVIGAACDEEDPREALMRVIMASAAWWSGAYSAQKRAEVTRRLEASRSESRRLEAIQAVVRGCLEQKSVESVERMTAQELPEFARSHPDCEASAVDAVLQQEPVAAEDGLRQLAHRANRAVFDRMVQRAEALSVRPGWRQQSVGALSTSLKIMGSAMLAVSATARHPPEPSQTQQQHTGGAGEAAGDKPDDDDDDDDDGGGTFVLTAVRGALFLLFSDSSFRAVIMTGNSPTSISHLLLPHDSTEGATPCRRSRRRSTSRSRKSKHRSRRRSRCSTWPSICRCRPKTCPTKAGQSAHRRSSSCTRRARRAHLGIGPH